VDRPFVAIEVWDEICRHCRAFPFPWFVANGTGHAGTAATAGARMLATPGAIGMILADPARISAGLARHW